MKVLCVGQSKFDITCNVENFPLEGSVNNYTNISEEIGGDMVIASYLLGKYKVDTYFGSIVGDDTFGSLIRKSLEKSSVHTEYMEIAYEKRTTLSQIFVHKQNKTEINLIKDKLLMKKTDFSMDPDLVLVDSFDYGASLSCLNKYANKITMILASTPNSETVELCKYAKYIIASTSFTNSVTGIKIDFNNPSSLVNAYSALLNKFPNRNIIVTLKEKGAMYLSDNQIKVMPGLKVEMVDSTGAKAIFASSIAYSILNNYDIEKAVTFANIASGLSVIKLGGISSIPDFDEIMKYFHQKYPDVSSLQSDVVESLSDDNK